MKTKICKSMQTVFRDVI